jgi:hypothetical protein
MKILKILLITLSTLFIFNSCKKEFDKPPVKELPIGSVYTIQQVRDLFQGASVKFTEDFSFYGVITMDESSGNIYRNVFIEDGTAALNLRLNNSGGIYQGDSVRVYLKGTILGSYNGMLQLDSVDVDFNIIKQKTKIAKNPTVVTIDEVNTGDYQSKLVKIEGVEFIGADLGQTYANAVTQQSMNRTITDCSNNTVLVRSSGYADFAGQTVATGSGSIIAVVGEFNGTIQLYVRNTNEVVMIEERCTGGGNNPTVCPALNFDFIEDFSAIVHQQDINIQCWSNITVEGNRKWRGRDFNGDKHAECTAFGSTAANNIVFLVSPTFGYSGNNVINFKTSKAFLDTPSQELTVWVSTDFDGSNAATANWVKITNATIANSTHANNAWVNSGNINISDYVPSGYAGNFFVGFRYEGNVAENKTANFRVDDFNMTY